MKTRPQPPAPAACLSALAACCLTFITAAGAADAQGTAADYARASQLAQRYRDKITRDRVDPRWLSPTRFWYRASLEGGRGEFLYVDAAAGMRRLAFDHQQLAAALTQQRGGKPVAADRLPIKRLAFSEAGVLTAVKCAGGDWLAWDGAAASLSPLDGAPPGSAPLPAWKPTARPRFADRPRRVSPDGRWEVRLIKGRLMLRDRKPAGGREPVDYQKAAKPDGERSFDAAVYWAPDSSAFVAMEVSPGQGRKIPLVQSSPEGTHHGKLQMIRYAKPGDRIEQRWPRLFPVGDAGERPVARSLMENPWEIKHLRWAEDASRFTLVYNQRGHRVYRLLAIDAQSGDVSTLAEEAPETFVDYAHKTFAYYLDHAGEVVWMSERDGWRHLYLLDSETGAIKRQLTRGPWVVRGVEHVDPKQRTVTFRCGGLYGDQDPYYVHFARVDLDTGAITRLTASDGTHRLSYSPDRRYLIATHSRVDLAPVTELRSAEDGSLICELERADTGRLVEAGWRPPRRFVAKGRDGRTDIYGVVFTPPGANAAGRDAPDAPANAAFPVVEEHYAGPHGAHCPKAFRPVHRGQEMAELGFFVVCMDGMGTSQRGKAFHDVCWKNLQDGGFPDRIAWMKALARQTPAMDLARVGIRGTSAGGQTAMGALLHHGDFYKVAVSNCGCHDNRVDKIWWNELWMSWPVGPHYAEQSNVTNAHKLRGDLLLIVGELDKNVDPISTLQVVDALVKADKDFEMLVIPGGGHGAGRYARRRSWDFLVEKLHGVEPRR